MERTKFFDKKSTNQILFIDYSYIEPLVLNYSGDNCFLDKAIRVGDQFHVKPEFSCELCGSGRKSCQYQPACFYPTDIGYWYKYWFGDLPWNDPESYLKRSPISYVGNIKTPTMVLTGEKDYRTPMAESEQLYAGLKLNKVESMLVRIPNANHGIAAKPSNLIAKVNSILSWFEKSHRLIMLQF